ncbi:uncharacterized protein SAPINGB_P001127 [Magnusiomyces paraingens]|uniref:IMS import disulfide relay-system CHCH-CHCH-like Cx9C domain-containing protein n=1 Tax=Magnusiomyces paraingens TaxID=2606893 RepID=A0A5E8B4Q1_9ASCO|nr:uncharacterized protein SAPINGB_P001127 [Saprochaete ingens]VVT46264.1 unnamed protein product [Saprochaete ingens]
MSIPNKAGKSSVVRPLKRFSTAVGECAPVGKVYGDCILANYQTVSKNMCLAEFMKLKECVQSKLGKKW